MRYRQGIREDGPEMPVRARLQQMLQRRYWASRWEIPDDFFEFSHYLRAVQNLDMTSSPGYPYLLQYPNNKNLFGVNGAGEPDPVRLRMVWELIMDRLVNRDADPIRLFVKQEPITKTKLAAGRNRLISSVSVVDQLIDSMLFGPHNEEIHRKHIFLPSKVGWSPYQGGWKIIPKGWVATDKSAWDWTMMMWVVEEILECRTSLCKTQGPLLVRWRDLASWRYNKLFVNTQFVTSGGLVFTAKFNGVQKSGSINTIDDNTMAQDILHLRACIETDQAARYQYIMGDDVLQEIPDDPNTYYKKLSEYCCLKQVVRRSEFAGHLFQGMRTEPLYEGKHAYVLLHAKQSVLPDLARSYALLYHRSLKKDKMRAICEKLGEVPTSEILDIIYDGE
uniref:RNA-directed RNA polymerase C-terminal domain-containing protein n=1 Tax=Riboviria sp. TaxID=2585031 RepID=A0A8K1U405_9VIRU|nr:MAG: hypothetical protein 1 [Riboviria sp.]